MTTPTQPVPGAEDIETFQGNLPQEMLEELVLSLANLGGSHGSFGSPSYDAHLLHTWEWVNALNDREAYENRQALVLLHTLSGRMAISAAEQRERVEYLRKLVRGEAESAVEQELLPFPYAFAITAAPTTRFECIFSLASFGPDGQLQPYTARAADMELLKAHGAKDVRIDDLGTASCTATPTVLQRLFQYFGDRLTIRRPCLSGTHPRVESEWVEGRVMVVTGAPGAGKTQELLGMLAAHMRCLYHVALVTTELDTEWVFGFMREHLGVPAELRSFLHVYRPSATFTMQEILQGVARLQALHGPMQAVAIDTVLSLGDDATRVFAHWLKRQPAHGYVTRTVNRRGSCVA